MFSPINNDQETLYYVKEAKSIINKTNEEKSYIDEDYIFKISRTLCIYGDIELFKLFYQSFPFILDNIDNLFSISLYQGHIDLVKYLYEFKKDIKLSGSDFSIICQRNFTDIIKFLYEIKPDLIKKILEPQKLIKLNYFQEICRNNNLELMRLFYEWCPFIKKVLDADKYLVFREASWMGYEEILKQYYYWIEDIPQDIFNESFILASKYGHNHIIKQLLEWNKNILLDTFTMSTSISFAIDNKKYETIKLLIELNKKLLDDWYFKSYVNKNSDPKINEIYNEFIQ